MRPLRWINLGLRAMHQVAVIFLAATLLGAPLTAGVPAPAPALAVLATGLAMFVLDLRSRTGYLFEAAGLSVLLKLALVGWMAADEAMRVPLFWIVVFWSTLFSHAPAALRHARWRAA